MNSIYQQYFDKVLGKTKTEHLLEEILEASVFDCTDADMPEYMPTAKLFTDNGLTKGEAWWMIRCVHMSQNILPPGDCIGHAQMYYRCCQILDTYDPDQFVTAALELQWPSDVVMERMGE